MAPTTAALRLADWTPPHGERHGGGTAFNGSGGNKGHPRPVNRLVGHPGRFSVWLLQGGVAVMVLL